MAKSAIEILAFLGLLFLGWQMAFSWGLYIGTLHIAALIGPGFMHCVDTIK
jgi:hypothetical protein